MSVTLNESIDMVRLAKQTSKILSIGFQSRYNPLLIKARELVQSGLLGQVYYVETGGGRRRGIPGRTFVFKDKAGGGAVLDIGCYSIDTAMYVLNHPKPLTVSACLSNHFGTSPIYSKRAAYGGVNPEKFDVDDFGAAMIRLEGGLCFMFKMAWAMHMDTLGPTMWLGTEAGLKFDEGLTLYHDQAEVEAQTQLAVPATRRVEWWEHKVRDFVTAELQQEVAVEIPEDLLLR